MPVSRPEAADPYLAHCRRVASLSLEVARRLRLTAADAALLEHAALAHHFPAEVLDPAAFDRLWNDLRAPGWPTLPPGSAFPAEVRELLSAFHSRPAPPAAGGNALLAEILDIANFFEERIAFLPFELRTVEQILDEMDWISRDGLCRPEVFEAFASLPHVRMEELLASMRRLPVFPSVALRALELTVDEDASAPELERLVGSDQVLAGRMIQAANSSLRSPSRPIAAIAQAIGYIGLEAARKVLTAAVFQPLFASASLQSLWRHSLEMADMVAAIARESGRLPPHEAFLAGLVHDIGRLALEKLPREDAAACARLREHGCEPVFAEMVLCGFDHGEAGAEILRLWSFPEHLVEAVQHHHWPERTDSPLAAAIHLAELAGDSAEDMPSWLRLRAAEDRLVITIDEVAAPDPDRLALLA